MDLQNERQDKNNMSQMLMRKCLLAMLMRYPDPYSDAVSLLNTEYVYTDDLYIRFMSVECI